MTSEQPNGGGLTEEPNGGQRKDGATALQLSNRRISQYTRIHQNTPECTEINVFRFRPPGSDRWRLLDQASGPLMQVLDRALKTLPFLYLFFTTFAFLPVKRCAACPYHQASLATLMQPFQGRRRLSRYPRVARASQPRAERFPSFQDGGTNKMRSSQTDRRMPGLNRTGTPGSPMTERDPG